MDLVVFVISYYNILLSPSSMDPQAHGISANHVEATLPSG